MSDGGAPRPLEGDVDLVALAAEPVDHRKARRLALIAARRCIQCRAGLLDLDGVRCLECTREHRAYARSHRKQAYLARALRPSRGICLSCRSPVVPGRQRCQVHLDYHAAATAIYLDRLEARAAASLTTESL